MKKIYLHAALSVCSLAACGHAQAQTERIETNPEIGSIATVAAGEPIYSFRRVYSLPGTKTDAASEPAGWLGLGKETIAAGTKLVSVPTSRKYKACVPQNGTFEPKGPCFIDDDGDGTFDRTSLDSVKMATRLKTKLPYSHAELEVSRDDSLRRVFLYQGATSDSIRFSYREFNFDLARPAFTEEISVPRDAFPAMVRVKNIQIEVLAVSGMGLQYRLVSASTN